VSPNDTRGEGGLAKVSRDSFSKILSYIHLFLTAFLKEKSYFFGKSKCHVTGGGGPCQCHQMTHGGGGGSKFSVLFIGTICSDNEYVPIRNTGKG
jgi:hypothetical protein